jgi:hypothetical protein
MFRSVLILAACSSSAAPPSADAGSERDSDVPVFDAGTVVPDAEPACAVNRVPLLTTILDGTADAQAVSARLDGEDVYLGFDSGSPMTFIFGDPEGPEYVPDAAMISIGCVDWIVDAIRFEGIGEERLDGRRVVGVLGLDFFEEHAIAIDYPRGELVQYRERAPDLAGASSLPVRGLEELRVVTDVVLDGAPLALMVDTGAPSTIVLGMEGRPGDEEIVLGTADGRTWTAYAGDGVLEIPGEDARTVPILRAPELDYVEETVSEVGAAGLLGMTSLGWRKLIFDLPNERLHLFPREPVP